MPPPRQVRRAPGRRRCRRVPSPSPGPPSPLEPPEPPRPSARMSPWPGVPECPRVSPSVPGCSRVSPGVPQLPSPLCSLPGAAASDGAVSPPPELPLFVRSFPRVPPALLPGRGHPRPHPPLFQQNKKFHQISVSDFFCPERWAGSALSNQSAAPAARLKSRAKYANQLGAGGGGANANEIREWAMDFSTVRGGVMQIYPGIGTRSHFSHGPWDLFWHPELISHARVTVSARTCVRFVTSLPVRRRLRSDHGVERR